MADGMCGSGKHITDSFRYLIQNGAPLDFSFDAMQFNYSASLVDTLMEDIYNILGLFKKNFDFDGAACSIGNFHPGWYNTPKLEKWLKINYDFFY